MEEIINVLMFCIWLGALILCCILVVSGVLRWLAPVDKRQKRLNFVSIIAFIILCVIFVIRNQTVLLKPFVNKYGNENTTLFFINVSKITIKLLMLGIIVASSAMLLFVVVLFISYGFKAIIRAKRSGSGYTQIADAIKNKSEELVNIMKTPIFMMVITWGIVAIFIILPLLMGDKSSSRVTQVWKTGVNEISMYFNSSNAGESFYKQLSSYVLIFIIVLGVGFATIKILYSIVNRTFAEKGEKELLDEYSAPIGLLAVGVSLLWTITKEDSDLWGDPLGTITALLKSFAAVIFIVALAILTLEIIRLLMDMREKIIRQEAKLLFVSLVGKASIVLLEMLNSIYGALNNVIGNANDDMLGKIHDQIRNEMIHVIKKQINDKKEYETVFWGFDEKITKK